MKLSQRHVKVRARRERGAAALLVVMLLFFVVSLVAAYTNRNLIFEQRTAANQYRSTQALEAADAGLQWAIALLNGGRINATCGASTLLTDTSFRQRYLTIDPVAGLSPNLTSGGAELLPSCVSNGASWNCSCPVDSAPTLTVPSGTDVFPAFRARFLPHPTRADLIQIQVNGCTRLDDNCLNFPSQGVDGEARVTVSAYIALKGAVSTVPVAPLTARGNVAFDASAGVIAANTSAATGGITVHAGGTISSSGLTKISAPGSPSDLSIRELDATLAPANLDADRMFATTLGLWRESYRDQPGTVILACGGTCTADQVRAAAAQNPGRILWIQGDLSIDSAGPIGSATDPVAVVVTGNVAFSAAADYFGLIYIQAASWNSSGSSTINGALIAEGNAGGTATATLNYNADILTRVRTTIGTMTIVPGSWRDF
jgi:Tfp pilus assembly protein PilX